ncbi:lipopolysaccharide biosynthesis protein [Rheinheimera sp. WS51]|uniref:lipopolysaccharide biosynthesis protein n=1 Tax=Rheinheimera sp. WS51 TaxID=3425886 RepID=UPI003D8C859C
MDSISSQARTAFKWTVYLRLLSQTFTWFVSLFVIRFLTPADYGIVALSEIIFMLALQFSSAGLGDALIRRQNLDNAYTRKILTLLIILNAAVALIQLSSASYLANYYNQPALEYVLYATASIFLVSPWIVIASSLLAKELNFKSRSKVDFFAALLGSVIALTLAIKGLGFWSLVIANLSVVFFRAFGYNIAVKKLHFPLWQFNEMLPSLKFGLTLMATGIVFTLFMKVDIIIAGKVINASELGYYALAMHLALMPMAKAMPLINEVAYPMYAAIQQDKARYSDVFNYILRIATLFSFPVFFGFAAIAEELVLLLLGDQWQQAILPLQIVLLTIPLRMISNLFTPLLKALGFPSTGLIHIIFSLGLISALIYIAAPYGINAIAIAWLIATPLFFFFAVYLCTSRSGILLSSIMQAVAPPLLLSSLMLLALFLIKYYWLSQTHLVFNLICTVLLGVIFYALPLKLFFSTRFNEALKFRI